MWLYYWSELILWLSSISACRFCFNITEQKTLGQTYQLYVGKSCLAMMGTYGKDLLDTLSKKIPQNHTK